MPDLAATARRLVRRLVATPEKTVAAESLTVSDGVGLVRQVETVLGAALESGGRAGLAAALGRTAAGQRAAAFLTGDELAGSLDLVATAARRRLPLVLHVTADGGHEACHAAADAGAVLFFAADVQDAADLTLLARRLAEDALAPVAVAMDGRETARAMHDARLPAPEAVARFLGGAGDTVHPPTPSQTMLFGDHRRRLPRWHDGGRPLLHGAEPAALAGASRCAFFDVHLPELLARAFGDFSREFGRRPEALDTHHADDARFLLLAQGAAVETATAAAAALRASGVKAGVVGLRVVSPFPAAGLVELLRGRRGVAVLERLEAGFAEPPLLAATRALLERARHGPDRGGAHGDGGLPALGDREVPPLASAFYGATLRAADVVALVRAMTAGETVAGETPSSVWLGIDTAAAGDAWPKRRALRDALRRAYPDSVRLGLRGAETPDPAPPGALVVSVHRIAADDGFLGDAAALLYRLLGGHLRARPAVDEGWGVERVDLVTQAASPLPDGGDGVASSVAVWRAGKGPAAVLLARIQDGGAVLLADGTRPPGLGPAVEERGIKVYAAREPSPPTPLPGGEGSSERILGTLAGVLSLEGRSEVSLRKLLQARRAMLADAGDVEARLDALQAGFERVARISAADLGDARPAAEAGPPPAVRRLGRCTAPLADLPGFWDRVGGGALAPDPFLATGTVPPLSSALRDLSPARGVLPAFDPAPCTGCGGCWSACPDAAVAPVAIDPAALLACGMECAAAHGRPADKLRMVASKVASRVRQEMAAPDWKGGTAGELYDAAFAAAVDKMKLPDERKAELRDAHAAARAEIAALPVARTRPFFDDADDGELFALALDPDACKGCGLCVAACEPGALTAVADDAERTAAARELWRFCDELPEASAATRERVGRHPEVGALAAALMSRAAREVMAGGHGAEPGSGAALALRQVLGVAADRLRPRRERQLAALRELKEKLASAIHGTLAQALPGRDLDALARGLDALSQPDAELAELTARVETAFEDERVDVTRARRLVEAARAVADLEWRWTTGESGLGQAPLGLVLTVPGLAWAASFPYQPFRLPVTVDATGDAADLARGLAAGRLAETVDAARVLRRARLELDRPLEAPRAAAELDALAWEDLDDDERALAAPLFVTISEEDLDRGVGGAMTALLGSDLPVKVLVLQAWAPEDHPSSSSSHTGLDEATKKSAFFVQSSVAHSEHLARAVAAAIDRGGPALLRVLAPSPARGGFAADETLARARERVESGAFALGEPSPPNPPLPRGEGGSIPHVLLPSPSGRGAGGEGSAELEARHAAEIAALRRDYEGRLAAARTGLQAEMARRLRARLMRIASQPPAGGGDGPEARG